MWTCEVRFVAESIAASSGMSQPSLLVSESPLLLQVRSRRWLSLAVSIPEGLLPFLLLWPHLVTCALGWPIMHAGMACASWE